MKRRWITGWYKVLCSAFCHSSEGHQCRRCDMFTTQSLWEQDAPRETPGTAPIKSTCKNHSAPILYIFYNSIAGPLLVRPFQANLCEVEQSPPLRARPARRATASDCHFWKSWESRESDGYNKCNGYHMAACNCPQIHKVYLFICILLNKRLTLELSSSLVSKKTGRMNHDLMSYITKIKGKDHPEI